MTAMEDTPSSQNQSTTNNKPSVVVDSDVHHATTVPGVLSGPVIVTVTVLQSLDAASRPVTTLLLDATAAEEVCAVAQVHVAVVVPNTNHNNNTEPSIAAIRKTGTGPLPLPLLPEITKLALQAVVEQQDAYTYKSSRESSAAWMLQSMYELQ
jgi:exosome complex RNA-binding protein Rrp42 (RNase PH superfamily)